MCSCWGSARQRRGGGRLLSLLFWKWEASEAGRVDRGWADDSILRRSVAPHLTDSIGRTDDGALRAAGLPCCHHFARPLPDTCSTNAVIIWLELFLPELSFLRLITQRMGCSLFIYCDCWGRIEVVFVFLEKRAGVDWCCVAGKHQKWVSLTPRLPIAGRSWTRFSFFWW